MEGHSSGGCGRIITDGRDRVDGMTREGAAEDTTTLSVVDGRPRRAWPLKDVKEGHSRIVGGRGWAVVDEMAVVKR